MQHSLSLLATSDMYIFSPSEYAIAFSMRLRNIEPMSERFPSTITCSLNTLRNDYRDTVIEDIENDGKNYQTSVYYMNIINTYERMGDIMINISQDLERAFIRK